VYRWSALFCLGERVRETSREVRRNRTAARTGGRVVMAFEAGFRPESLRRWWLGVALLVLTLAAVLASAARAASSAYVTNYGGGNVSQFDVGAGGVLTAKTPA